jgi:hypothetical protein
MSTNKGDRWGWMGDNHNDPDTYTVQDTDVRTGKVQIRSETTGVVQWIPTRLLDTPRWYRIEVAK